MAKRLQDKAGVDLSNTTDYPYGDIKDDTGNNDGTPVNREVYGDIHQFFARMLDQSGVTPNGFQDNASNGYQLYEALMNVTERYFCTSNSTHTIATYPYYLTPTIFTVPNNMSFQQGQSVRVNSISSPNDYMYGYIVDYTLTQLSIVLTKGYGSGTYSDWYIYISSNAIADEEDMGNLGISAFVNTVSPVLLKTTPAVVGSTYSTRLTTTVLEIGPWDMQANNSLPNPIITTIPFEKILNISVVVRNDADNIKRPFDSWIGAEPTCIAFNDNGIAVFALSRNQGYNDFTHTDDSINRGWITIIHEV